MMRQDCSQYKQSHTDSASPMVTLYAQADFSYPVGRRLRQLSHDMLTAPGRLSLREVECTEEVKRKVTCDNAVRLYRLA